MTSQFFRFLLTISFPFLLFLLAPVYANAAAAITERFTLPASIHPGINAYFDIATSTRELKDVTGYACAIDTNGSCPWKLGRTYDNHTGIDFRAETGDKVFAAASGKVMSVTSSWKDNTTGTKSYGNLIIIQHEDDSKAYYSHLQAAGVIESGLKTGDQVERGQFIARSDNNGSSHGSHLHFEIRNSDNKAVDPFSEKLWITDGTENVITSNHILTAEEYLKEQEPPDKPASVAEATPVQPPPKEPLLKINPPSNSKPQNLFTPTIGTISTVPKSNPITRGLNLLSQVEAIFTGQRYSLGLNRGGQTTLPASIPDKNRDSVPAPKPAAIKAPSAIAPPAEPSLISRIVQFVAKIFTRLKK